MKFWRWYWSSGPALLVTCVVCAILAAGRCELQARPIGARTSSPMVLDTGNAAGGFDVTVGTSSTVLISASGATAGKVWRVRTFQVTGVPYAVWITTYSASTWNSGAGWLVLGSTGSWTTNSQAAYYGKLDPTAGASTAVIHGAYEYEAGETPAH
jgi:hypothetical protein